MKQSKFQRYARERNWRIATIKGATHSLIKAAKELKQTQFVITLTEIGQSLLLYNNIDWHSKKGEINETSRTEETAQAIAKERWKQLERDLLR